MKRQNRFQGPAGFLWIAMVLLLRVVATQACRCAAPPAPLAALQQAKAVFEGQVVRVQTAGLQEEVTLTVTQVWKGGVGATATVLTPSSSEACGYTFSVGDTCVVYAQGTEGDPHLYVSLCSRTRLNGDAEEDYTSLGPGQVPGSVWSRVVASPLTSKLGVLILVVGGIGLVAVRLRRRGL